MEILAYDYIGYIATAIGMSAYLFKSPKQSLKIYALAECVWLVYFIFLNSLSAIIVSLKTIFRSLCGSYMNDYNMRLITFTILIITAGYFIYTSTIWFQYMPLMAAFFDTVAIWFRDSFYRFRAMMILSESSWIIFGVFASALPNVICAILTIIIIVGTIYRNRHINA